MTVRRILLLIFGIWLGGSAVTAWMAAAGFANVDRLLRTPSSQFEEKLRPLGREDTRLLLRYAAAEFNRTMFQSWGVVQLALGAAALLLILFGTSEGKLALGLATLLLMIVLLQQFVLIPQIIGLGRFLDFLPAGAASAERGELRATHAIYSGVEIFKMLTGTLLVWRLNRTKRRAGAHSFD